MKLIMLIEIKIIFFISRLLGMGSGFTWPGHFALSTFPQMLDSSFLALKKGCVILSGTNGKTTTAKLISHILEKQGLKVVSNKSGANLLNGIVSAILLDKNIFGKNRSDIGVFEVDEFALPGVLEKIQPKVLLLLNLSRDQLDRYGEVDIIFEKWKEAVSKLNPSVPVVADLSQEQFKQIPDLYSGHATYFNDSETYLHKTNLVGTFNAKNINACLVVCSILGYEVEPCAKYLEDFSPAYGRGEVIDYKGKHFSVFLAKNPASFNHNLELLTSGLLNPDTLLFILNDNIPDGRDVSWIYDVDPIKFKQVCGGRKLYIAGTRCLDMSVRLSYAGVSLNELSIFNDLKSAIKEMVKNKDCLDIMVLPNYSSMLEVRKILTGKKIL